MRRAVVVPQPLAEGEVLDVEAKMHRQALAARPAVVLALGDGGIVVAAVRLQHGTVLTVRIARRSRGSSRASRCAGSPRGGAWPSPRPRAGCRARGIFSPAPAADA